MLKADIQKNAADAKHLASEIAIHDADISAWTGDKKAASKVRELENLDYQALCIYVISTGLFKAQLTERPDFGKRRNLRIPSQPLCSQFFSR